MGRAGKRPAPLFAGRQARQGQREDLMVSARLFFAAMYLHLAASIAAPIGIIATADMGWTGLAGPLLLVHLAAAVLV